MYRAQTSQAGHALLIIKIRQGASSRDVTFKPKSHTVPSRQVSRCRSDLAEVTSLRLSPLIR